MGLNSSRVNPAIVSREEQRAFIPIYENYQWHPAFGGLISRLIRCFGGMA